MEQKDRTNKMMNSKDGLSVYGYIRENFDQKCLIQEIIKTIIQFCNVDFGFLFVCGNGQYGKLGIKELYNQTCRKPTLVQSVNEIVDIATNSNHTMLVDCDGRVWAFGCGEHGALGTGKFDSPKVPRQTPLKHRAICVSVGNVHSLILIDNANVLSCGLNSSGQLGHGNTESQFAPKVIEALKRHKIIQISAGNSHNGALSEKGDLFMWGWDKYGQCGVGHGKGDKIKTPTLIKLNEKVSVIECGSAHTLSITTGNLLYSSGYNSNGQLGDSTNNNKYVPTLVDTLKDVKIVKAAAGYLHTICVDDEFNVWSFGNNSSGQCARSDICNQLTPKKIEYFAANNIKAIECAAGSFSSCVITQNNECFVFGSNAKYQLGFKEQRAYPIPTKLPLFVQKASMGSEHSTFIGEQQKE